MNRNTFCCRLILSGLTSSSTKANTSSSASFLRWYDDSSSLHLSAVWWNTVRSAAIRVHLCKSECNELTFSSMEKRKSTDKWCRSKKKSLLQVEKFSVINTDGDTLTHLAVSLLEWLPYVSIIAARRRSPFPGWIREGRRVHRDSWMESRSLPVRSLGWCGREGRLVGRCPRLRGPDLGWDSSSVPFSALQPGEERENRRARRTKRRQRWQARCFCCVYLSFSLLCPSLHVLPLSLCLSGHLLSSSYYCVRRLGSERSQRLISHQGNNTVAHPHVASELMNCWTLGDRRRLHIVAP